jgi:AraC family transcriptional regulator
VDLCRAVQNGPMQTFARNVRSPPPPSERSLISEEHLQRWQGLPIGYFDANPDILLSCNGAVLPTICMLERGRGMFEMGRDILELQPGATGIFVPEAFSGRKRLRCTPGRRIVLTIDLDLLTRKGLVDDDLVTPRLRANPEFYDAELAGVLRAMATEVAQGCPNGRLLAESLSLGVCMHLAQTRAERPRFRREHGRLSPTQIIRIDEMIQAELAAEISLGTLAALAGFSKAHFTRLFKNTTGMSPHRYVLKKRVETASKLVTQSRQPLADIAAASGFASQSHMTEAFSRQLGVPPGELRRMAAAG